MTSTAPLDRPHVWRPGTTEGPLLLLHGTGGDEHDLLPLGDALVPGAALLSPRGTVLENGMPRFFRRLREGVFDEDDLRVRAKELAEFVAAAGAQHAVTPGSWYAVGFSNGANIASALLLRHPEVLAGGVLFAAMVPFAEPPDVDLTGKTVILANGRHDPMATADHTRRLVSQLRERGAEVTEVPHDGGHGIDPHGVARIADDPVFWLHHCNLDRLWAAWQMLHARSAPFLPQGGASPGHNLRDTLIFGDPMPWVETYTAAAVTDTYPLGYSYDSLQQLAGAPAPTVLAARMAAMAPVKRDPRELFPLRSES